MEIYFINKCPSEYLGSKANSIQWMSTTTDIVIHVHSPQLPREIQVFPQRKIQQNPEDYRFKHIKFLES